MTTSESDGLPLRTKLMAVVQMLNNCGLPFFADLTDVAYVAEAAESALYRIDELERSLVAIKTLSQNFDSPSFNAITQCAKNALNANIVRANVPESETRFAYKIYENSEWKVFDHTSVQNTSKLYHAIMKIMQTTMPVINEALDTSHWSLVYEVSNDARIELLGYKDLGAYQASVTLKRITVSTRIIKEHIPHTLFTNDELRNLSECFNAVAETGSVIINNYDIIEQIADNILGDMSWRDR